MCVQPAPDAPSAPAVCVEQTLAVCSPPSSELPRHTWGHGLSVGQFKAAVEALPMQQPLRWKSLYPAIGSGARGQVFQAVNLDTGGLLAVKVVPLKHLMGRSHEAALRREALVLELAAMQDHLHPNLLSMQVRHAHHSRSLLLAAVSCSLFAATATATAHDATQKA